MQKQLTCLNMIAAKIMKKYKKWPNMTKNDKQWQKWQKQLTFLNMVAAKIMKTYEKLTNMTKLHKNIDIFEYDCSENNGNKELQ